MSVRKLRKQPKGQINNWNFDAENGERYFEPRPELEGAYIYDLTESRGMNKRDAGELTPRLVRKHGKPRVALLADDGLWYWND